MGPPELSRWISTAWLAVVAACGGGHDEHAAVTQSTTVCTSTPAMASCVPPQPSFASDVAPLLNRACNLPACHAAGGPAWPLARYADVAAWAYLIRIDVDGCTMPPADAGSLSARDHATIDDWIACGARNN